MFSRAFTSDMDCMQELEYSHPCTRDILIHLQQKIETSLLTNVWFVVNHPFSFSFTLTSFSASSVSRCSLSAARPDSSVVSTRTLISERTGSPGACAGVRVRSPENSYLLSSIGRKQTQERIIPIFLKSNNVT
jgi:hypothetical protein